jgi:hypothetical protein
LCYGFHPPKTSHPITFLVLTASSYSLFAPQQARYDQSNVNETRMIGMKRSAENMNGGTEYR